MSQPRIHSYTWSDVDKEVVEHDSENNEPTPGDPLGLVGKELHLWVTYPDKKRKKVRGKAKRGKNSQSKPSLWAVIIVEEIEQRDDFTYGVTFKRIYKQGERHIAVTVENDPTDQSEEAKVFSFLRPTQKQLDPLEQQLCMWAAQRVYHAIAETWEEVYA